MSYVSDIMLSSTNDLLVENGDFSVGYSDDQHIMLVLMNSPGQLRHEPLIGIGIDRYKNSRLDHITIMKLKQEIRLQLQLDGFDASTIETIINDQEITVNAER
ncbi:MAG: hypothetical protein P0Y49_15360 [Candidatus Pedobacter colombiensis]|uniref:Uncharacterized protein n=1 Tax=Candidatus Pedobacter colombiensis TaxID=3121371 RepID=A0AAJ6B7K5_9SPHI|nr:hypothetical protein [Pedobacter sp.]WEK18168.1 MAG: hypothetical protein P0Y49_15360 [Pedobacter sp.]